MTWALLVVAAAGAGLTEDQAVGLALDASLTVRAFEQRRREELANGAVSTELTNPQLRLQSLRTDRLLAPAIQGQPTGDAPLGGTMVALRWKPPNPMVNAARANEAARRGDELGALAEAERRAVAAQARTLHATALNLAQQVELDRAQVDLRARLSEVSQKQLLEKGVRGVDASLAALEELDARADLLEREQQWRAALLGLAALLDRPGPLTVEGPPRRCAAPVRPLKTLVELARAQHPLVKARKAKVAAYEAERSQARRALVPWFDYVQVGYTLGNEGSDGYGSLRLGISFPLLNWGGNHVELAAARRDRAEAEADLEARQLTEAVERAFAEATDDAALVARYEQVHSTVVAPNQERLQRALESGEVSLVDFAKVQARTLKAQRSGLKAQLHCVAALIELERLTGAPR